MPTDARAYQRVPTGLAWGGTDRASTHRAHRAPVDRRRAIECLAGTNPSRSVPTTHRATSEHTTRSTIRLGPSQSLNILQCPLEDERPPTAREADRNQQLAIPPALHFVRVWRRAPRWRTARSRAILRW
jgi:hypothetical protein